jgi:WD40 repeat protein
MRVWEEDETRLVEASRLAEAREEAEKQEQERRVREAEERQQQAVLEKQAVTERHLEDQKASNLRLRKGATRLKWSLAFAALGAVVAMGAAWLAAQQTGIAKARLRTARSRQLAALSVSERSQRLDRSLLFAMMALQTDNTLEARNSLFDALQDRPGLTSFLRFNEGTVSSVAFSPDGRTIAAGYRVGTGGSGVVLWDAVASRRLDDKPLLVEEGYVSSVAFSPDGQTIATGYWAGTYNNSSGGVVLWDAATRRRLDHKPLPVDEDYVSSVAFSPDGRTIAAGGGRVVVLWNAATRRRLDDKPLPLGAGPSVAFSPDGRTIAVGSGGGVVLWDAVAHGRLNDKAFPVKEGSVRSIAFSPDGHTIAAGYDVGEGIYRIGGGVVLWDMAASRYLDDGLLLVKEGSVRSVAFSADGQTIAAGYTVGDGAGRGGVVLWDAATRRRLDNGPLPGREGLVGSMAFSPHGRTIAAGCDGGVVLWDLDGGLLSVKEGPVSSVAFSADGRTIAAGYESDDGVRDGNMRLGGVVLWDAATRWRLNDKPFPVKEGPVLSVAFSPDGRKIAAGCVGGVVLWDVAARQRVSDKPPDSVYATSVAFGTLAFPIAAGCSKGVVLLDGSARRHWDVGREHEPDDLDSAAFARGRSANGLLPMKEGAVTSVAFSPDSRTIAAGYTVYIHESGNRYHESGGGVVLWDAAASRRLDDNPLPVKEGGVNSVAFSPDGRTIAAGYTGGGPGGGVVLWDTAKRRCLDDGPLPVKEGAVKSVAFSPDGRTIAAGYAGGGGAVGGVVLWDAAAHWRLADKPLLVKKGSVEGVAFSPDSRTIAAGCDGGVVLWDGGLESWQRRAGQIAGRNFTQKEWRDDFPETPYRAIFPDLPVLADLTPNSSTQIQTDPQHRAAVTARNRAGDNQQRAVTARNRTQAIDQFLVGLEHTDPVNIPFGVRLNLEQLLEDAAAELKEGVELGQTAEAALSEAGGRGPNLRGLQEVRDHVLPEAELREAIGRAYEYLGSPMRAEHHYARAWKLSCMTLMGYEYR